MLRVPVGSAGLGEAVIHALIEAASEPLLVSDPATGELLYVNEAACAMLGYAPEALLRLRPEDIAVVPETFDRPARVAELETAGKQSFGIPFRRADGSTFPVDWTVRMVHVEGRAFLVGTARDISEHKRMEAALRASEERFRLLVSQLHVGVLVMGPTSEILISNPQACELLGITDDQLRGKTSYDPSWNVIHEDGTPFPGETHPVPVAITSRCPQRGVVMGVFRPRTRDRVWILVDAEPELDADGQVMRVVCTFSDITALKEAERALRASEASLRHAQKMEAIGRFAGGIAHDFNNMLSPVLGYTSMLLADLRPADPAREPLEEVKKAAQRAAALTRQLLTFTRQQVVQTRSTDLNEVVTELNRMVARVLGEDIELTMRLAPGLDPVLADPSQLEQVIVNLVVNARDAMPHGGQLTIETSNVVLDPDEARALGELAPGAYVCVSVTDTGTGMAAEVREHLFEPFFTTKAAGQGTGLGLATTYGIVRQFGGGIRVRSEPGHGATFDVLLPRHGVAHEAAEPAAQAQHARTGTETVLLVEDDDLVRRATSAILRREGYTVLEAANAGEGLLLCERHSGAIHLLLTDVVMPTVGGLELARRLESMRPKMRVVYMSGYARELALGEGTLDASVAFVQKPFTPVELARKLREVLDAD